MGYYCCCGVSGAAWQTAVCKSEFHSSVAPFTRSISVLKKHEDCLCASFGQGGCVSRATQQNRNTQGAKCRFVVRRHVTTPLVGPYLSYSFEIGLPLTLLFLSFSRGFFGGLLFHVCVVCDDADRVGRDGLCFFLSQIGGDVMKQGDLPRSLVVPDLTSTAKAKLGLLVARRRQHGGTDASSSLPRDPTQALPSGGVGHSRTLDEVIPGLWICNHETAQRTDVLLEKGIRLVVVAASDLVGETGTDGTVVFACTSGEDYVPVPDIDDAESLLRSRLKMEGMPPPLAGNGGAAGGDRGVILAPSLSYVFLPLQDNGRQSLLPFYYPVLRLVSAAIDHGAGVLVHCRLGVSRSASLVAAYLMLTGRCPTASDAIAAVRRARPIADPNLCFRVQLFSLERRVDAWRRSEAPLGPPSNAAGGLAPATMPGTRPPDDDDATGNRVAAALLHLHQTEGRGYAARGRAGPSSRGGADQ